MSHIIKSASIDVDIGMPVFYEAMFIDIKKAGKVTKISASQDLRSSTPETIVYNIEEQEMSEEDSK